jgi:hypothetical protein
MVRSSLSSDFRFVRFNTPDLLAVVLPEECHEESGAGMSKFTRNRRPDPCASGNTGHESSPVSEFSIHNLPGMV